MLQKGKQIEERKLIRCGPFRGLNVVVTTSASLLVGIWVVMGAFQTETVTRVLARIRLLVGPTLEWYYVVLVAFILAVVVWLGVGRYRNVPLGAEGEAPEFSFASWIAMLFAAGTGVGLIFWSIAEPVSHFQGNPFSPEAATPDAAVAAMRLSYFHWGLHGWAVFAIVGLVLAYFGYRKQLPLTIRSALHPFLGERIYRWPGDVADTLAVFGTVFGVATTLGLGATQMNTGLDQLTGVGVSLSHQLVIVAVVTALATISVVSGVRRGVRLLSVGNLWLSVFLLAFFLVFGPTAYLLGFLVQSTGSYLQYIVEMSFWTNTTGESGWQQEWTVFYWGWWLAWSPFVGMFIARVSRGRTIREFVFGVLFVPVGFTAMWMTFFGNTAINMELGEQTGIIAGAVAENVPVALFTMLELLPFSTLTSGVATLLVITFFVTSSDSGSLVIDMITSGGNEDPPVWQRIFWAVNEGIVAAVLLLAGGLAGLQTAAIAGALPFSFIMLLVCYGLLRGLQLEGLKRRAHGVPPPLMGAGDGIPWQRMLRNIVSHSRHDQVMRFIDTTVNEALLEVARELERHEVHAELSRTEHSIGLTVYHDEQPEFVYAVEARGFRVPRFTVTAARQENGTGERYYRAEVRLAEGCQSYDVMGYTKEQIISDVLTQYDKHMQFLHLAR